MPNIPLGVGAYSRPFGKLPEIRMENRFFEKNPVGEEQVALLSRPGTSLFLSVGDGPIRALYTQPGVFEGDLFIVSGNELYRYNGTDEPTLIDGEIAGEGYPVMTSVAIPGWEALFITDGATLQHYTGPDEDTHELGPCSVPDGAPISDLATLASYVICAEGESRKFYWIQPGEVDIDPLDFSSAESEPDQIVSILTVGDQLWIFGQSSTEAWYASGDGDQPFLRTQGRAFSQGIIPGTVARVQESIMVIGQDMVAYRIAGSPERISHHGIEEMIRFWQTGGE
jgi:hypothetical protein